MNYGKLWRMCVEHDVSPSRVFKELGISSRTLANMKKNQSVTIDKICTYFKCQPHEIMTVDNQES